MVTSYLKVDNSMLGHLLRSLVDDLDIILLLGHLCLGDLTKDELEAFPNLLPVPLAVWPSVREAMPHFVPSLVYWLVFFFEAEANLHGEVNRTAGKGWPITHYRVPRLQVLVHAAQVLLFCHIDLDYTQRAEEVINVERSLSESVIVK